MDRVDWRLWLGEGFISFAFSLIVSTSGSILAYLMLSSLAEREQGALFDMTYLQAAPRFAAFVYGIFFLLALLALTRLRVYGQATARPGLHWTMSFFFYGLVGLVPGLVYWLLLSAANRPGI